MSNVVGRHPNTAVAAGTGFSAATVVAILSVVGVTVPPALAAYAAVAVPVVALAVGRRGVRGIVRMIWRGSEAE